MKWLFRIFLILFSVVTAGYGIFQLSLEISLRRGLLQSRGLPVTFEHLCKAGALKEVYGNVPFEAGPPQTHFAQGLSYADLLADGEIRVSIYRQEIEDAQDWPHEVARINHRAAGSGVHFRQLFSAEELREALILDDVVIFFGHSNLGQGLNLYSEESGDIVLWQVDGACLKEPFPEEYRITPERVALDKMAEVRVPLFLHLGCQSWDYYGQGFMNNWPESSYIFTRYQWAPGEDLLTAVDGLCQALEQRCSVEDVLTHWEKIFTVELLNGRARQLREDPTLREFPESMFRYLPGKTEPMKSDTQDPL